MPPVPKPKHLRQRTNKTPGAATLPTEASMVDAAVPDLPGREGGWHPEVLTWWEDVWRSPMASEYLQADYRGLTRLAVLVHDFWAAESAKERSSISAEIRLQEVRFGLSPIDRRRLDWTIANSEQAVERNQVRRRSSAEQKQDNGGTVDPRDLLRLA